MGRCGEITHLEEGDEGGGDGSVAVDFEAECHVEGHSESQDDNREEEGEEEELEARDAKGAE